MRVAVACMMHETNTFNPTVTPRDSFHVAVGEEVERDAYWMSRNVVGGIIDGLRALHSDVCPTFFARAIPSGLVAESAYRGIRDAIVKGIRDALPIDGICLALHGSMCAEGEDDPEGDLLERIRETVGPGVPITCALDMHATVTSRMVRCMDGAVAYLTAPHLDELETGKRAVRLLRAALNGKGTLAQGFARLPILIAGEMSETDEEPMSSLLALRTRVCEEKGLLDASFCLGFPWADSPHACVSVLTVGRAGGAQSVQDAARFLAGAFWEKRNDFTFTTPAFSVDKALSVAMAEPGNPVIVSDSGDNPTAGASQDSSTLLATLSTRFSAPSLVSAIADRKAFEACQRAGSGAFLELAIGKEAPPAPEPFIAHRAHVRRLTTCQGAGIALVEVGPVLLILSDRRIATYEPSLIIDLGLTPADYKVIAVKCGYQGPEYRAIAARSILALTPGDTAEDLLGIPYVRTPRPIFPLDADTCWSDAGQ